MKRARNVAQAVVRTPSSLSSWSCMGARRRTVGTVNNSNEENAPNPSLIPKRSSESLTVELVNGQHEMDELEFSCSQRLEHEADEEEELIPVDHVVDASTGEDMTEGQLWYELEKELHRQEEAVTQAREEEAAAAKEIAEEENVVLADAVESRSPTSPDASETHRFYPPGRIMHIVVEPPPSDISTSVDGSPAEERVGIYETPRNLYSKLRLSRTMVNDHYMPMYKKMMELLISELKKDELCDNIV